MRFQGVPTGGQLQGTVPQSVQVSKCKYPLDTLTQRTLNTEISGAFTDWGTFPCISCIPHQVQVSHAGKLGIISGTAQCKRHNARAWSRVTQHWKSRILILSKWGESISWSKLHYIWIPAWTMGEFEAVWVCLQCINIWFWMSACQWLCMVTELFGRKRRCEAMKWGMGCLTYTLCHGSSRW